MKIGLVSDTHGDVEAWGKAMRLFAGCDYILHAGDHFYNGAFNPVLPAYYPKRTGGVDERLRDSHSARPG